MKRIIAILVLSLLLAGCSESQQAFSTTDKHVSVYTTASGTDLRLTLTANTSFSPASQPLESEVAVFVNPNKTFQTFWGIGAAITDASAEVYAKLPADKQAEFLKAYFDVDDGIGYTLARVPIHSCDFSSGSYVYVSDQDKELKTFNISHDKEYRIPMIKRAIEKAGGKLPLYASPWSPPEFMKSNNNMLQGGKLLPEYYESWALYYTKFIKEYEKEGVKFTLLSFIMKAVAAGLKKYPRFNSSLDASGENLIMKNYFHVGVAVDTPDGLVVPVVRDVDKKSIVDISLELREISIKAREKKLMPSDMQGGCMSISSLGGIGGTKFTPIVNAPEVGILGVSKADIKPRWNGKEFEPRMMLPLCLSYDHRAINGGEAGRLLTYLTSLLSDIRRLML